jgi:two-component system, cell cycle response regulator DivK
MKDGFTVRSSRSLPPASRGFGAVVAGRVGVTCILIVEDHDLNRDMLSRRLKRRGFKVVAAADGAAGVEAAVRERPDLVLMDMSLPVVDGWQATRMIKANPETSTIPVMALTAHALREDRERALEAGCDEFETKPVDLDRLLAKIDVLLSRVRLVNSP